VGFRLGRRSLGPNPVVGRRLAQKPLGHRTDAQSRPLTAQRGLHLVDELGDLLQLVDIQIIQPFGPQGRRIDPGKHRREELRLAVDGIGYVVSGGYDPRPVRSFHHHHRILLVAEFPNVLGPEFIELALRIEQV
jgi:hypothetical protein